MKLRIAHILAPAVLPLTWAALLIVFILLYRVLGLPTPAEILPVAQDYLERYGPPVLILAAFVECVFMVSVYFPGSLVIAIAVAVSGKSMSELVTIGLLSWLGFVAALPFNYWLGEKGFYKVLIKLGRKDVVANMQARLQRRSLVTLMLAAMHPNILAIAMVCMGIARRGVVRSTVVGALCLIPWVALIIGILAAVTKRVDVTDKNQAWYFVAACLIWAAVEVVRAKRWRTSTPTRTDP